MKRLRSEQWAGDRGEGSIFFFVDAETGQKVSRNLYISYRAANKEHVVSAKTDDLDDAKKELRRLVRNRENAREGLDALKTPKHERLTVRDLVAAYLDDREFEKKSVSIAAMRSHAKPVLEALGPLRAVDLNPDHVARYKKMRRATVSDAKVSRELEILKAAFGLAAEEGRLRVVPVIKLPTLKNVRKVFFPLERLAELLAAAAKLSEDVRDFLQWLSFSGMRPKAMRLLRWSDLDQNDWTLTLRAEEDKNKAGRVLSVAGEAREILERRIARRRPGDVYIFGRVKPIGNKLIWKTWNAALAELELPSGVDGFRPYDLKKTAIRALRRAGIPEERAMHFSGHSTTSTFRRYDQTASEDNFEDMERVTLYRKERMKGSQKDTGGDAERGAKLLRLSEK